MSIPTVFRTRDRRGAAAVELALVLPVLFLIVFGMIEFARGLFLQAALSGTVREGARYAATLQDPGGAQLSLVKARMQAYLATATASVPPLNPALIEVYPADPTSDSVRVSINNYPIPMMTPIRRLIGLTGTSVTVTRSATFRHEVYQ